MIEQFNFKKPIIEKNKELEKFIKKFAKNYENEYAYYDKGIERQTKYVRDVGGYHDYIVDSSFDFKGKIIKTFDYADTIDKLFCEEILKSNLSKDVEQQSYFKNIWSTKIYCPYTKKLVRTVYLPLDYYSLSSLRKSTTLEIPYVPQTKIKGLKSFTEKCKLYRIGDYNFRTTSSNRLKDYYDESVLTLFKNEWGYYTQEYNEVDNHIKTDELDSVDIFYSSTNGYIKKEVLFNFKKGRYVKKPVETVILDSPDIEDFDIKLRAILNGDIYSELDMSNLKSPTEIIQDILNEHISETEKLNKIKELLE